MRLGNVKSHFFPIMLGISVGLSALSAVIYHTDAFSYIYDAAANIVTPVEKLTIGIRQACENTVSYFADVGQLRRENEQLIEDNARLLAQTRANASLAEENEWLRKFLGLKNERTEMEFVDAKIVARDIGFIRTFTLDKGSMHGISENMPVITEDGLIGLVTEAGISTSRGISLINNNMSVGVYMERTMTSAVLTGSFDLYSDGLCKVINLPSDAEVYVGDMVYTSGYGSIYPKDIVVGTVVSVEPNPENYTLSAIVQPAADVNLADYVMVVTESETLYE
ncbi:MAG: rod shape-determining protein MreC [Ruminococcaceae bacterium]|nr:rod shape-determining protein MreC [Oscillospiraceae bacterium]